MRDITLGSISPQKVDKWAGRTRGCRASTTNMWMQRQRGTCKKCMQGQTNKQAFALRGGDHQNRAGTPAAGATLKITARRARGKTRQVGGWLPGQEFGEIPKARPGWLEGSSPVAAARQRASHGMASHQASSIKAGNCIKVLGLDEGSMALRRP